MQQKRWFMRSSAAVLTIVTHCCLALPTNSWNDYSQFRMQLCPTLRSHHWCWRSSTGCQSGSAYSTNGYAGAQVLKWTCAGISHHRLLLGCSRRSGTRSAGRQMLEVVRMTTSFGDRSFAPASPCVWNSLPNVVCNSALSENAFAKLLNTYLMNCM